MTFLKIVFTELVLTCGFIWLLFQDAKYNMVVVKKKNEIKLRGDNYPFQ